MRKWHKLRYNLSCTQFNQPIYTEQVVHKTGKQKYVEYIKIYIQKNHVVYIALCQFKKYLRTFRCLILKHLGEIMLEEGKGRVVKGSVNGDYCEMGLKTRQG